MQRLRCFLLVALGMLSGVTFLAGYILPLTLHHLLKLVGLDHWVQCGTDYTAIAYVLRIEADHNWWHGLAIDAAAQLHALPFFAILAIVPALGVALWIAIRRSSAPYWFSTLTGALPGIAIVVAFIWINSTHIASEITPISTMGQVGGRGDAINISALPIIWMWFVSYILLVAVASAVSAPMFSRWGALSR